VFGAVGTLQNVATISSPQITPVEVPVVVHNDLRCDWRRRQEQCSDQREFLHLRSRSSVVHHRPGDAYWPLSNQSVLILTSAYEDTLRSLNLLNRAGQ
jgi:hypothetical protein